MDPMKKGSVYNGLSLDVSGAQSNVGPKAHRAMPARRVAQLLTGWEVSRQRVDNAFGVR